MIDPLLESLAAALDQAVPHGCSLERLSHFQCGSCGGWWSIGDAPENRTWHCPWCGHYARTTDLPKAPPGRPHG